MLSGKGILASIVGGHSLECRKLSAEYVSKDPDVSGFVINGLHNNGPQVMETDLSLVKPIIKDVLVSIPLTLYYVAHIH